MSESLRDDYEGWDIEQPQPAADRRRAEMLHSTNPVRAYLNEISRTPLLNAEEEVVLAKRIESGVFAGKLLLAMDTPQEVPQVDAEKVLQRIGSGSSRPQLLRDLKTLEEDGRQAKDHLMRANLRLVVSVAKRYTNKGMDFLDLIQEGNSGLIRAVEKFDYTKGYKFSTYATWWIRQGITRAMADQGRTIRLPVHVAEQVNKVVRTKKRMHQELEREATSEEIGLELAMDEERIQELLEYEALSHPTSLERTVGDDGNAVFGDFIEDTDGVDAERVVEVDMRNTALQAVLKTLDEREQGVVRLRFGLDGKGPRTLETIGKVYGLSRERVRQIEREVMAKLRRPAHRQRLQDYIVD